MSSDSRLIQPVDPLYVGVGNTLVFDFGNRATLELA